MPFYIWWGDGTINLGHGVEVNKEGTIIISYRPNPLLPTVTAINFETQGTVADWILAKDTGKYLNVVDICIC